MLQQDFKPQSATGFGHTGDVVFSGLCWVGVGADRPFRVQGWAPKGAQSWARPCFLEAEVGRQPLEGRAIVTCLHPSAPAKHTVCWRLAAMRCYAGYSARLQGREGQSVTHTTLRRLGLGWGICLFSWRRRCGDGSTRNICQAPSPPTRCGSSWMTARWCQSPRTLRRRSTQTPNRTRAGLRTGANPSRLCTQTTASFASIAYGVLSLTCPHPTLILSQCCRGRVLRTRSPGGARFNCGEHAVTQFVCQGAGCCTLAHRVGSKAVERSA
jgi:hypothetical protein